MLVNLPRLIKKFTASHKDRINLIINEVPLRFIAWLVYALLPIIISSIYDEMVAGIFIGVFSFIQTFILNPIIGNLSDKYGSKRFIVGYKAMIIACGFIWLLFDINKTTIIIFSFLLFLSFSMRINDTYLLRTTNKEEGGLIFGISENLYSIGYFCSTLAIPFFALGGNEKIAAGLMILLGTISIVATASIKDDMPNKTEKTKKNFDLIYCLNPLNSIKKSIIFIKKNNGHPLIELGSSAFQGIFYGTIWFVFPLYIVSKGITSIESGLMLGIYEIVTIFIAGYCGYLADRYNWKHIHSIGWLFIIFGVVLMPFFDWPLVLIIIGFVIGIGNNLSVFASKHSLEKYDDDHKDDGSFMSVNRMAGDLGYTISPVISGFLYFHYGFKTSLAFSMGVCAIIGVLMIYLTYRNDYKKIFS